MFWEDAPWEKPREPIRWQEIRPFQKENTRRPLALFQKGADNGETEVLALRGEGLSYLGLARYEEAEQAFQKALEAADEKMPETRRDLYLYLASAQYRQEKYEDAIDTCEEILAQEEENADALFIRGASSLFLGNESDAREDFDAASDAAPQDYDLFLNIYACYDRISQSAIGDEYLNRALNIQGEDAEHSYNRGRIYYYLENYTEAENQLLLPVDEKHEPRHVPYGTGVSGPGRLCAQRPGCTRNCRASSEKARPPTMVWLNAPWRKGITTWPCPIFPRDWRWKEAKGSRSCISTRS